MNFIHELTVRSSIKVQVFRHLIPIVSLVIILLIYSELFAHA